MIISVQYQSVTLNEKQVTDHGRFSVGNKRYRTSFVGNAAHMLQNGE